MPEAICKPAASVSKVIIETAMACAAGKIIPKSVKNNKNVKKASKYASKFGLIGKMQS